MSKSLLILDFLYFKAFFFSVSCFYSSAVFIANFPAFWQYVYLTLYEEVNV